MFNRRRSSIRARLVGAALSVGLVASSAIATTAATAATPDEQLAVEGVVRLLVADPVPAAPGAPVEHVDDERLVLVVGDESYFLTGEQAEPNTRVSVVGTASGDTFHAISLDELGPAADSIPPEGTTKVLVILAHWREKDSVTTAYARSQVFQDSDGWYDDASYGQLGQEGDVTDWYEIDGPVDGKCYADHMNTMNQAKAAAEDDGWDLGDYDNFILYSPNNGWQEGSDCNGYAGWAYVGTQLTWLNGYIDRRVLTHEQGHNYGLSHSHSYLCTEVIEGSCSYSDYGDDFDAMGASGLVGHFSAPQKDLLGWLDGRKVDLTDGGSTTLAPMAKDQVATVGAVVRASSSRSYWLEYRQAIDFDSQLPASATNGVLLHVTDQGISGDNGSSLLDSRPADGLGVFTATIRAGESWTTPEGYTLSVDSVSPDGADVEVSLGDTAAPTIVFFDPRDGAKAVSRSTDVTVKFSEAVAGVNGATFTLRDKSSGETVTAVVAKKDRKHTWGLDPSTRLDRNTHYKVRLTGGAAEIRDLSGNPLKTKTWSFKTKR